MSPTAPESEAPYQNGKDSRYQDYGASDAFKSWFDFYRQMSEEGMTAFQKGLEATQKFTPFAPGQEMYSVWIDSVQDFHKKVGQESLYPYPGMDTESYKKMYEAWLEAWSKNLDTYMRTPEFASRSGKDLERFSDFKKQMGNMLEAYWESIHLPSAADMREVYQKLYVLERKFDDMDRRFRSLEKYFTQKETK